MSKMKSDRKLSGFTLIELLVVIAIISLLSSTVLASLSGARASARDTRRASDFDQLRKAVQAYITDNGQYPGAGDKGDDDKGGVRLSQECTNSDMYDDLVNGGYLEKMITDPVDNVSSCNDLYKKK
jgi:prepilin-type N-terminal cleavage/methylation domain-containing protein